MRDSPVDLAVHSDDPAVLLRLAVDCRVGSLSKLVADRVAANAAATPDARALCRGDRNVVALDGFSYAGGAHVDLEPGSSHILVFGVDEVHFIADTEFTEAPLSVDTDAVTAVDITGPGRQVRGGRFIGGGLVGRGVDPTGALEGMAIAAVLNSLTTRETVRSFVRIAGEGWEAIFVHVALEPDDLRNRLSPAIVRARQAAAPPTAVRSDDEVDLVSRLERLSVLLDRNLLTPAEFAIAKARILAGD